MPFVRTLVKHNLNNTVPSALPVTRPAINPPARQRAAPASVAVPAIAAEPPRKPAKEVRPKRQADGDYDVGYCRPPKEHQFDGSKPGPGRPKGSKSQDTLLREELDAKQVVRIGGDQRKLSKRAIAAALWVNTGIEKREPKHLAALNSESRRLFPEAQADPGSAAAYDPAMERQVLAQMMELFSMGEPNPDAGDPLADLASGRPDLGHADGADAWAEGEWSREAVSLGDDE